LAQYYRDYVELVAHFDKVLPGRVHRVFHEHMIRDPETEIRRLLAYCGLPFEEILPALLRDKAHRADIQFGASAQNRSQQDRANNGGTMNPGSDP